MRRILSLAVLLAAAATALVGAPASAQVTRPIVGVGEQSPSVFSDPFFERLKLRHVRYVVGSDDLNHEFRRSRIDAWMAAARAARARVVVAFNISRDERGRDIVLNPAQYRRMFLAYRKRYPFVREYISWNEGNHSSQPTAKRPGLGARYFDTARRACPKCTIVAADLLDDETVPSWVARFRKAAKARPRIWGLHNYIDANTFKPTGTRALLKATGSGQVWFTETGGLVWRRGGIKLPQGVRHAAKATRYVFRLANLSRRVKRVYFYHWTYPEILDRWDSAIMDRTGQPRPAYSVLRRQLRAGRARP